MNDATAQFRRLAEDSIDAALEADPVGATWLGDHRFDDRLPDYSPEAQASRSRQIDDQLTAIDAIDDVELDVVDLVDLEILRSRLQREAFEIDELASAQWNPMEWNPGTALHLLLSRDFAPWPERLASMQSRLSAIPEFLDTARRSLDSMPHIHVETAIGQLTGTRAVVTDAIGEQCAVNETDLPAGVDAAVAAIDEHIAWLNEQLPVSTRSPRLNQRIYAGVLWHSLDDATSANHLMREAEAHLDEVTGRMREAAAEYLDESVHADRVVRRALERVAAEAVVTDSTVLPLVREALEHATDFVRDRELVSIPQQDTEVIEMPEIHRGVAVAYCDAPGPLEEASVPTYVAVSPTPESWDQERVASFYREYNAMLLHDLTIHEAMPGHVLQLAHAARAQTPTRVRRFGFSGVFVEGWAVYAEELLLDNGYAPEDSPQSALAIRLQQLKMQARMAINTILDIRVHSMEMSEDEALRLMTFRGFQEEGEAIGKWRRALLTAGQLPTYFVGYQAVRSIANDLRVVHPDWSDRQVHDLMLSHGSPAPRHLRTLIGI
ncbi:DUF885 domain-containing protein [Actinomycetota bacterium]|nr:DUF885 domain-containing protein [Actinomycetota bacterium]